MPTPPGEVGVGASERAPDIDPDADAATPELGPGEDTESVPEEEEERRRCLSEPPEGVTPLEFGICCDDDEGGETEDDVDEEVVVGTAVERGDEDDFADAPAP